MDKKGRKRNKAYYVQQSKRSCFRLDGGMKGFLLTCNNNEKRAVQECYNILNEYADKILGPESNTEEMKTDAAEVDDFEAEIRKEVEKSKVKNSSTPKRFQVVDTRTTNCVFIKTTVDNPDKLISTFLNDVYTKKESKCRHILRIHPVLGTCRAVADKIEKLAEEVLKPFFQVDCNKPSSYCIVYKVRCNSLGREEILHIVGKVVHGLNSAVKVNFDDPDYVVSIDILQKFCCISVMSNYFKYRKYNVQELCKTPLAISEAIATSSVATKTTSEIVTSVAETTAAIATTSEIVTSTSVAETTAAIATTSEIVTSVARAAPTEIEISEKALKTHPVKESTEISFMAINSDAVVDSDEIITT